MMPNSPDEQPHIAILVDEIMALLVHDRQVARAIDGTLGAGGHAQAMLEADAAQVLGFDLDTQALAIAQARLDPFGERVRLVHDSYVNMRQQALQTVGWRTVDAILLDLGVSSMQFDTPERGFSFRYDAPLDMRFNRQGHQSTAADIVNTWAIDELADIFYRYGEERHSRLIARAIETERKTQAITTTQQLANLIERTIPKQRRPAKGKKQTSSIHPATRVFQALRIAVNDELGAVERILPDAIAMLNTGGRLAVITFHSLEDRIVKQAFKEASTAFEPPPGMASMGAKAATVTLVNRKPIAPSDAEMAQNPRSRSAKLRVVEKLAPVTNETHV